MSTHRSKSVESDRLTSLIGLALFIFLGLLTVSWLLWPDEVKPLPSVAEPVMADADISLSQKPLEIDMEVTESLPTEKRDAISQRGLGASLAQAPLPKPSSKRELPKDLSLGEHVISLRGGEWRLRLTLTLSSDEPEFVRFAGPMRQRLIEMTFFLVSHRVPEGVRGVSGEERLRRDLLTRFQNVLRGRDFDLYIDGYSIEEAESFFNEE